jgi:hypothetical protein
MTPSLTDFNYHIIPGDVLLLSGTNKAGVWNRVAQRLRRPKQQARFTHVALVLTNAQIADAMPHLGVSIRNWRTVESHYDLEKSMVARHQSFVTHALNPSSLLDRVRYYIEQPYILTALLQNEVEDQAGVVCSQFVALVLKDMKLDLMPAGSMKAWPTDIDLATRGRDGWRQFAFREYGLCTQATAPALGDKYWEVLRGNFPLALDEDQQRAAERLAGEVAAACASGDTSKLDAFLAESDTLLAELDAFQRDAGASIVKAFKTQKQVSQDIARLDRLVLDLTGVLNSVSENPELREAILHLQSENVDSGNALSGGTLLQLWRHHFLRKELAPMFLHARDAPERLRRHRENFVHLVTMLRNSAEELDAAVKDLGMQMKEAADGCKNGLVSIESLKQISAAAAELQKSGEWLGSEPRETVAARIESYESIVNQELLPWFETTNRATAMAAFNSLESLMAIDGQRASWPVLSESLEVIIRILNPT